MAALQMRFNAEASRYAELKAVEGDQHDGVLVARVETVGSPKVTRIELRVLDGRERSWIELKGALESILGGPAPPRI